MPQEKSYFVYIVTNKPRGTLYIGFSSDLMGRTWQHRQKIIEGFTRKYNCTRLVYFEIFDSPTQAIHREKRLKHWLRNWKIELIEKSNPEWRDLYQDFFRSSGQAGG